MSLKRLLPVLLVPTLILLIPLGATLFKVEGWAWGPGSFLVAWVLLAGVGLAYQLVTRQAVSGAYRAATALGLTTGFIILWINGAVGIIGSEDNPMNLLFGGVLLLGVIGAVVVRLEARGMARTLGVVALAQFLVPVVAYLVGRPDFSPGVVQIFAFNLILVLLFAGSALLFLQAARTPPVARAETCRDRQPQP
jgi:hypothetical protein